LPGREYSLALAYYNCNKNGLCSESWPYKADEFRQSARSVTLGCVYQDVAKTITQGMGLGSKLQQWVIREYRAQRTSTDKVCNNLYIK